MPDQPSEPNVRLEGIIDPQPHQQSQELPNIEPVQGDLSVFAAKVFSAGLIASRLG